jgi:hypothetical protein
MNTTFRMSMASKVCSLLMIPFSVLVAMAQPANDDFANREEIVIAPGTNATITGTLSNATSEAGEPMLEGISSGQTAWWTWTAPSNGIATLSVLGTNFVPLLTVYTGDALTNLSSVGSNNYVACYSNTNCGCHWRERLGFSFHAAGGRKYEIAIDSAVITDTTWVLKSGSAFWGLWASQQVTNILPGGNLSLQLSFTPAPANDDFEHPIVLTGSRTYVTGSNAGATKQQNEPDHLGNPGGSSVWYSWKAPASGRVTVSCTEIFPYSPPSWSGDVYGVSVLNLYNSIWASSSPTCGTEVDINPPPTFFPIFAAYTGTTLDTSVIASNCLPLNLAAYPNAVQFDAVKGQTYHIAFDGNMGTTDTIPLYLALTPPASNDHFKNRIKVRGINVAATGFNAGATHETGEPCISGSTGKSVWWSWTAPVSGNVSINLSGSDYSFPVGVFSGAKVSNLVPVASDTGGVSFDAVQGQTYQIAIQDAGGLTGAIKWTLQAPVIELPLVSTATRSGSQSLLTYAASPRQIVLLQVSTDGSIWQNRATTLARRNSVTFIARPAPGASGPFYRAIVVDYQ